MNDQDNQVDIPDFQPDLPVEENQQQRNFMAAMRRAKNDRAPIQVFQNLLNDAPPVSLQDLYDLTAEFLSHNGHVVPLLLKHEPRMARHQDPNCGLLLHKAIKALAFFETIELILDTYPEAIFEKSRDGFFPLHLACEHTLHIQTLELLFSRYPGAASVAPEKWDGSFPLHRCLRNFKSRPDGFILTLIEAYPEAASIKTSGNETALHFACFSSFSLATVQRLYQLYPESVNGRNDHGRMPLHLACQSKYASLEIIKFLLQTSPEAAQSRDLCGQLPLHYAVLKPTPLKVVQMLIETYPNAVNVTDNHGKLPLHLACRNGAPLEVLQLLLNRFIGDEQHHNGLSVTDRDGYLPIHWYAFSENARPETLRYLLELYPGGVHVVVERSGKLPLHYACESNPPVLEIIRLLVEAAPYTVIQKRGDERTPLQCIRPGRGQLRRNVEVEMYLLERQNEVVDTIKETFVDVAYTQLGLPDLVIANVWSFAKPDLWTPDEEDWGRFGLLSMPD